jgi:cyclic pyranopterin phosphate synthase
MFVIWIFWHLFMNNFYNMIDVGNKNITLRRSISKGTIFLDSKLFNLIKNNKIEKGDPLRLAEISGIMAVKKTSEIIPLCHNINIDKVSIKCFLLEASNSIDVYCYVSCYSKTGVEMESLTGVFVHF